MPPKYPLTIENALREPGLDPYDLDEGVLTRYRATRQGFARRVARAVAAWAVAWCAAMLVLMLPRLLAGRSNAMSLARGLLFAAAIGAGIRLVIELLPRLFRVSRRYVEIRGRRPVVVAFDECRLARVSDDVYRADFVRHDGWGTERVALSVGVKAQQVERLAAAAGVAMPSSEPAAA